jgi:type IV pilus assembly protein PilQ
MEIINLAEDTSLNDALIAIETLSEKYEGKKIYNLSDMNTTIDVPINQLHWKKALELIALQNNLVVEEQSGAYLIQLPQKKSDEAGVSIDSEQIKITATAFVADHSFLKSLGIDWSTLLNGDVQASASFSGGSKVAGDIFQADASNSFTEGGYFINIDTMLRTIESNQLGKVLASPNIIVASGKKGYIQVGQDFSIKSVDEAGNVIDNFFSTGVILDVTPTIIEHNGQKAIHMQTQIERSTANPGELTTIINKSQSRTDLVMYDGEETAIAGLYSEEENVERGGIPILKDLPWWFFGIRYLTGYDKTQTSKKELVIILKVEIIPSAIERMKLKE